MISFVEIHFGLLTGLRISFILYQQYEHLKRLKHFTTLFFAKGFNLLCGA